MGAGNDKSPSAYRSARECRTGKGICWWQLHSSELATN